MANFASDIATSTANCSSLSRLSSSPLSSSANSGSASHSSMPIMVSKNRSCPNSSASAKKMNSSSKMQQRSGLMIFLLVAALILGSIGTCSGRARDLHKRSFTGLGCLGVYDKAKFARLDRVCEECYQLYREPELHAMCRQDCFRNDIFSRCVDALLLTHEQKKFEEMVEDLYGK